jgi:enoyl-CoA hydratase/carnithine racemase
VSELPVRLEHHGPVALIEIARPEKLNAIDALVCDGLAARLDAAESDPDCRVVVLAGAGRRAFSAGADLAFMGGLEGRALRRFIERTWEVFERFAASPLPTIAALHGHVLGGGAELALACDLRLIEEGASLGFPEMGLGGLPGSGAMQRLPELIGRSRALELVAFGRRLSGSEAAAIGLANRVVAPGAVRGEALAWAAELAGRPAESLRYAKLALRIGGEGGIAAAFHGLVSSVRQADPSYRASTRRFRGEGA